MAQDSMQPIPHALGVATDTEAIVAIKNSNTIQFCFISAICATVFGCATTGNQPFRVDSFMAKRSVDSNASQASTGNSATGNQVSVARPASDYMIDTTEHTEKAIQQAKKATGKESHRFSGIKSVAASIGNTFTMTDRKANGLAVDDPTSLANKPKNLKPELFVASAAMFEKQGANDRALDQYQRALAISSTNRAALIGLARLYHRQGEMQESLATYRKALEAHPNDPVIQNDFGLCLLRNGQPVEAIEMLQQAVGSTPSNSMYQNNLAAAFVDAGRTEEAISMLTLNYGPAVAHYNVGYLLQQRGQNDLAYDYFSRSLSFDPKLQHAQAMMDRIQPMLSSRPTAGSQYQTTQLPIRQQYQQQNNFTPHVPESYESTGAPAYEFESVQQPKTAPKDEMHRIPLSLNQMQMKSAKPIDTSVELETDLVATASLGLGLDELEDNHVSNAVAEITETNDTTDVLLEIAGLIKTAMSDVADEEESTSTEPSIQMPMPMPPVDGELKAPEPQAFNR